MKRYFGAVLLLIVLILSACVPNTVTSGSVVVRGQPTPAPSVDYAALAAAEDLVFITPSGSKYHKYNCPHVSDPPIAITLGQAEEEGYTPCSRCHEDD